MDIKDISLDRTLTELIDQQGSIERDLKWCFDEEGVIKDLTEYTYHLGRLQGNIASQVLVLTTNNKTR